LQYLLLSNIPPFAQLATIIWKGILIALEVAHIPTKVFLFLLSILKTKEKTKLIPNDNKIDKIWLIIMNKAFFND